MKVHYQVHTQASYPCLLHIEYEAGWATEPVWAFVEEENILPCQELNHGSCSQEPSHYTNYTTLAPSLDVVINHRWNYCNKHKVAMFTR